MPELRRTGNPTLHYALDDYTDPWRDAPHLILQHGYGRSGRFWYSWVPGEDFMPVSPTNITSPTGWTEMVTNAGSLDGFAIQWTTSSAPLAAGSEEILIPGEPEARNERDRRAAGVTIDDETWRQIRAVADEVGVRA